jgi:hypothetical protein
MKVLIAYICVSKGKRTGEFLSRFRLTYDRFPPGYPHEVVCCCNGGPLEVDDAVWMRQEWKCYLRKNDPGWDLSAYFDVARNFECDILVCLGESCFFHREGWLKRIVDVEDMAPHGMYGFYASNLVTKHLNTTGFAIAPALLRHCSIPKTREERLAFEHGKPPFWKLVANLGRPVKLVTFDGAYDPPMWRAAPNALWKGNQSSLLVFSSHTERFFNATPEVKRRWERHADVGLSS